MASILDRYGIKEVADVTFYALNDDGSKGAPVLYLDTLKVSTIEQTAESTDARGGKGNAKLVTWDYGKEITVTLQDALFSAKSLAMMYGYRGTIGKTAQPVVKSTYIRVGTDGKFPAYMMADIYDSTYGSRRAKVGDTAHGADVAYGSAGITAMSAFDANGSAVTFTSASFGSAAPEGMAGEKVLVQYTQNTSAYRTININADEFPGTYYIQGDTYARSDVTGKDQFFQFIIKKAKVTSENTLTLEAEGDPAVFDMNLTVLRPEDGEMMQLIQYDLAEVQ